MLPKFMVIGAMKCGTTSLYLYLSRHPDLVNSELKETNFFKTDQDMSKGIEWYKNLFRAERGFAYESSPNYTKRHLFEGVPERIHSVVPNIKLIYLVRNPADRIFSHYVHRLSKNKEDKSFQEIVRQKDNNYYKVSQYFYQIEPYLNVFPKENIKIILSEDLRDKPIKTMKSICQFLDISEEFHRKVLKKRYHSSEEKLAEISKISDMPVMSLDDRKEILSFLSDDLCSFKRTFNIDLPY